MVYLISNIKYDTDGKIIDLPTTMEIEVPNNLENDYEVNEYLSNKISDITGFCHKGFVVEPELKFIN